MRKGKEMDTYELALAIYGEGWRPWDEDLLRKVTEDLMEADEIEYVIEALAEIHELSARI